MVRNARLRMGEGGKRVGAKLSSRVHAPPTAADSPSDARRALIGSPL